MIILPDGNYPLNNTEEVLQHTLKLQNFFDKKQLLIIYIQHINRDLNAVFFVNHSYGSQLHVKLLAINKPNELNIQKAHPNSFYHTQLQQKLEQLGNNTISNL
ncbi:hypothetical protein J3U11_07125 [Gilliamella sp. B2840]|uniref:hypothetical protein n=1 Tax=Gilliamella sp. B2840 TaxID=2817975 RepID=UPI00226AA6AF|nr:hypothetical protein [Gilliamella sp. B2840]MCX8700838.1 hypothetical protein [Gilliamella sp. B2840]